MSGSTALLLIVWVSLLLSDARARNFKLGLVVPTGEEVVRSFAWETAASATTIAFEKIESDPTLLVGHTFRWVLNQL